MRRFDNPAGAKEAPCPRCKMGRIMTGRHSQFNARSAIDNKQICADCRINEIVKGVPVANRDSGENVQLHDVSLPENPGAAAGVAAV